MTHFSDKGIEANGATQYDANIQKVATLLQESDNILFITGAGISAESGLPTYRGIGGLYNDNVTEENIPIEMALSGHMIVQNPELTWRHLARIENACRGAQYNRAHKIISQFEKNFERVWVLTQNVDGFHKAAGSQNVVDIHGDFHALYCPRCAFSMSVPDYSELEIPPRCPECEHILRPDVVLFGEYLSRRKTARLYEEFEKGFEVIFSIGTTSGFPYIAGPIVEAVQRGVTTVEINPSTTDLSDTVAIKFFGKAVKVLNDIWTALQRR